MGTGRRGLARALIGSLLVCALLPACGNGDVPPDAGATDPVVCDPWHQSDRCGGWRLAFDGYGTASGVQRADGWRYRLAPRAVDHESDTAAALALSEQEFEDVEVSVRLRTREQLRRSGGNPWEVAWLVWHHTDNEHFYYLTLKPNGWEIGKADPAFAGSQQFLATGTAPTFPVGPWYEVTVRQVGAEMEVTVDGVLLARVVDPGEPYRGGSVGLYTEDAAVEFEDIQLTAV
ncbi:hypothetical protein GCM10027261_36160 [Geodermatophilus arenarius]